MILARIRGAWSLTSAELAKQRLELLVSDLDQWVAGAVSGSDLR